MPHCIITTNVLATSKALSKKAATAVAEGLSILPEYVKLATNVDENLIFDMSDAPAAIVNIAFIGPTDAEKNNSVAATLTTLLNSELSIDPNRISILIEAFPSSAFALGGKTF